MEEKKEKHQDEETVELNIEELMNVQGGEEDDDENDDSIKSCGLGCFQGSGSGGNGRYK